MAAGDMRERAKHIRYVKLQQVTSDRMTVPALHALALLIVLTGLATFRQPLWPAPWQDEGFTLQGAINLAQHGLYAMRSAEGFRVLDQPLIANGPGIVLPLAVAFEISGTGYEQARAVAAIFMVLTGLAFFAVARALSGLAGAWIALFVLIALPGTGYTELGRTAIGTVPGLGYFLIGGVLWLRALDRNSALTAAGAGMLFGLAAVTKGQYSLLIFPAFALTWLLDRALYRRIPLRVTGAAALMTAAVLAVWYAARLFMIGPQDFAAHLQAVNESSAVTVLVLDPLRTMPGALSYLARSGAGLVIVLSWLWAARVLARREARGVRLLLFASLSVVWCAWYLIASVGWERYAFDAFALACLSIGGAVLGLARFARTRIGSARASRRVAGFSALAVLVALGAVSSIQLARRVDELTAPADASVYQFADYLNATVPENAVIETWEWQLAPLARHAFHFPENAWVDRYTASISRGARLERAYDAFGAAPSYLIDGPFSFWTEIYRDALRAGCCDVVNRIGSYALYRVREPGASRQ